MHKFDVPEPDAQAREHSARLQAMIRASIRAGGGWLDFSAYMQQALYTPELGYYAGGLHKFGVQGDFVTAPEISGLFGSALANAMARILKQMKFADVLEFGAGSGNLAADVLQQLHRLDALPEHYFILELSAELQQRQAQTLQCRVPDLCDRVVWLQALPDKPLNAVVLANEVLDAMPVNRFVKRGERFYPLGVVEQQDDLVLQPGPFDARLQHLIEDIEKETGQPWCEGYVSEINLHIAPWLQALSESLNQGAIYLIDYGYPRAEYYAPERSMGTLLCYYRHRSFDNPLRYPGLQDITAFVDFTAVAEAAVAAGLDVDGFTSQGNFLLDCGLPELMQEKLGEDERQNLLWIQQMKTLVQPSEMGERFKVMGLGKNLDMPVPGFGLQDMRYRL